MSWQKAAAPFQAGKAKASLLWDGEAALDDNKKGKCGGYQHNKAHGPDLAENDFQRRDGMTSRCSTVPCSRSRISAAPVMHDGEHGSGGDDVVDRAEPGFVQLRLKRERSVSSTGTEVAPR